MLRKCDKMSEGVTKECKGHLHLLSHQHTPANFSRQVGCLEDEERFQTSSNRSADV